METKVGKKDISKFIPVRYSCDFCEKEMSFFVKVREKDSPDDFTGFVSLCENCYEIMKNKNA